VLRRRFVIGLFAVLLVSRRMLVLTVAPWTTIHNDVPQTCISELGQPTSPTPVRGGVHSRVDVVAWPHLALDPPEPRPASGAGPTRDQGAPHRASEPQPPPWSTSGLRLIQGETLAMCESATSATGNMDFQLACGKRGRRGKSAMRRSIAPTSNASHLAQGPCLVDSPGAPNGPIDSRIHPSAGVPGRHVQRSGPTVRLVGCGGLPAPEASSAK
jgi:hypothetical protein